MPPVLEFSQPLTASSSPLPYAIVSPSPGGYFAIDALGRLYSGTATGFNVYALPLGSAAAPTFSFAGAYSGALFDESGDLISSGCSGTCVAIFAPPFSATSVPVHEFAASGQFAVSGHRIFDYVRTETAPYYSVSVFDPPYVTSTATFALGGIDPHFFPGVVFGDPFGNLIVAASDATDSGVYVYSPPFTGGTAMPSASVDTGGVVTGMSLDGQGHLLVLYSEFSDLTPIPSGDALLVYDLPLTTDAGPVVTVELGDITDATGSVGVGP